MKNKAVFIFFLMLFAVMSCSAVYASDYRGEVAVGLIYGNTSKNSVTVASSGGAVVYNAETGAALYTSAPGEEIYIEMGSTGFIAAGKFDGSGMPKISVQPQSGATVMCNGTEYRGYIYVERRSGGDLLVINYVGTDDYVSSVLGKEMSYSWPKEALKAQAVCARNFVLCRGNAHKNYNFDVCPTTHCQVYGGVASEHENTRQAVNETKGVLATYNGKIVALYFYATSGGRTEDVENVWGSPYGYLKAVDDPYENPEKASKYTWTETFTPGEIEEKLKAAGINIGALKNITVDSKTASGRVTGMTFYGTSGEHSVKLEKCRTVLGLYSQKFTVNSGSNATLMTTGGAAVLPLYASTNIGDRPLAGYSVLSGNGIKSVIKLDSVPAKSYTITGGGYGHGVGMSQWGARGMAENGFTYDQILHHYFTDIQLG